MCESLKAFVSCLIPLCSWSQITPDVWLKFETNIEHERARRSHGNIEFRLSATDEIIVCWKHLYQPNKQASYRCRYETQSLLDKSNNLMQLPIGEHRIFWCIIKYMQINHEPDSIRLALPIHRCMNIGCNSTGKIHLDTFYWHQRGSQSDNDIKHVCSLFLSRHLSSSPSHVTIMVMIICLLIREWIYTIRYNPF